MGTEDNGPAKKWQALIQRSLNSLPGSSDICVDGDFEGSNRGKCSSFSHRRSSRSMSRSTRMIFESGTSVPEPRLDRRFSVCEDRTIYGDRSTDYYDPEVRFDDSSDDEEGPSDSPYTHYSYSGAVSVKDRHLGSSAYSLVASKQMVGIFLTVWIKSDLRDAVRNLKVSCVGRGLMGYLGNKVIITAS